MAHSAYPFRLPFIRWADVAVITAQAPLLPRQLYDHELVYVLEGHGIISIHQKPYPAHADDLFLIQPQIWHSFTPDADSELHLLGIHFDWAPEKEPLLYPVHERLETGKQRHLFRSPQNVGGWDAAQNPCLPLQNRKEVRSALQNVMHEYQRHDEESQERAGALLAAAILTIQRALRELRQLQRSTLVGPDALRRAERARNLLEQHFTLSINEAAAAVDWSPDHLRRIFKAAFGASPSHLQTLARLHQAQHLLRTTDFNIATISERCGFYDPSHFTRVFKTHCGLSPRQFWRMAKKK